MAAPPPPAAAAPALPAMVATQVARVKETIDGLPVDQLRTIDGRGCVQLIRTLRPALSELVGVVLCNALLNADKSPCRHAVGKVKSAIVCDRHADGSWRPRAGASLVAVKQVGGGWFAPLEIPRRGIRLPPDSQVVHRARPDDRPPSRTRGPSRRNLSPPVFEWCVVLATPISQSSFVNVVVRLQRPGTVMYSACSTCWRTASASTWCLSI